MKLQKLIADNIPLILTSAAVAGVCSTTVLAVKATPEAHREIMDAQSEQTEPLTNAEKVRLVWRHYIPSTVVGLATISAVIGAQSINMKRQAALVGIWTVTDKAFSEYREKAVEMLGAKKDLAIREAVVADRMEADPLGSKEIIVTGLGEHMMFDSITGRYFESDIEAVRKAVNDINFECNNNMYASQNDFYRLIGLPTVVFGEEAGWSTDRKLEVSFVPHIGENGKPCIGLDYNLSPIRGYTGRH